ncbi:MAG: asparagine synthetase A [candidate division WOR-3 bacterium]
MEEMIDIMGLERTIKSSRLRAILRIASEIRFIAGKFLREKGFLEINPVIISPLTDPLRHQVLDASIHYLGMKYQLTKSMIFHKQIALLSVDKIFIFSPNVRLEPPEYSSTGNHLIEFTQIDLEMRNATRETMMELAEEMIVEIISQVVKNCYNELSDLGRNLKLPTRPFKRYRYLDLYNQYGNKFEMIISRASIEPFWVIDFPIEVREFYDREYEDKPGILCDMDLIYPEGYGEALSGGEREFKYERIVERMKIAGNNPEDFKWYLEFVKKGLFPSCGFGIGLERLTRFICGLNDVSEATLFPKTPGRWSI